LEKAGKQNRNVSHKSYLILIKYLPYPIAFGYCINTFAGYWNIDLISLGYIIHLAFLPWLYMLLTSRIFKFCYVHRLPLYYILLNDMMNIIDYYIGIPVSTGRLFQLHLVVVFIFISLYTYGYIKHNKKFTTTDN